MNIEDIINGGRYPGVDEPTIARWWSDPGDTPSNAGSEARPAPNILERVERLNPDGHTTNDPKVLPSMPDGHDIQRSGSLGGFQPRIRPETRRRSCVPEHAGWSTPVPWPANWPTTPSPQPLLAEYGQLGAPLYCHVHMMVPMHTPPQIYPSAPQISLQPQHRPLLPPPLDSDNTPATILKAVSLPQTTHSLCHPPPARNCESVRPRIRTGRVKRPIQEYNHLSFEETIRELARRDIHIPDVKSAIFSKTKLVRLLQRADRNQNRGGSGGGCKCGGCRRRWVVRSGRDGGVCATESAKI